MLCYSNFVQNDHQMVGIIYFSMFTKLDPKYAYIKASCLYKSGQLLLSV